MENNILLRAKKFDVSSKEGLRNTQTKNEKQQLPAVTNQDPTNVSLYEYEQGGPCKDTVTRESKKRKTNNPTQIERN